MVFKIIIVDDDRDSRETLQVALEIEGYTVMVAANGLNLISLLHVDHPDLILLSSKLSWIDSFDLCWAMKQNEEFCELPVILISSREKTVTETRALEVGALDCFSSPLNLEKLTCRIQELVKKKQ
jgi:DNA-binding response OmpR family regulator